MFVILAIVICILVAIIFAFYKKGDELAQYLPWLWKHIGQPLFNYLFVTSIRKVTIVYFGFMGSISISIPIHRVIFYFTHEKTQIQTLLEFDDSILDLTTIILGVLSTLSYFVFIIYEIRKLKTEVDRGTLSDIVEEVTTQVGRGSTDIVKNMLPSLKTNIEKLHIKTALELLETIRKDIASYRMPDWNLLSKIDYMIGMCAKYADGEKVLRAKIDMASPNMNMLDPVIYRVAHMTHHRTGDTWCIYPMYDFAHPIEDAIEGITHSICTLEFEDHRPLYDWVVRELEYPQPPKQIEFAKLYLTNVVTGKRYIKKLVEDGIVDGWDDPRLVSIAALRRRGFTPESIKMFVDLCGVSKANSSVDYAMLEYCIREDLKLKRPRMMAVMDPVKLVIDNYPEGQVEYLDAPNNMENETLGTRKIPFSGELYIERDDFMIDPPRKYKRLFLGTEVRLMNAYFVTCTGYEADDDGTVRVVHCTYDPATKGGNAPDGRKVKGTIHWVEATNAKEATVRLYENIVDEEKGVYNKEDGSLNVNPNSLTTVTAYVEPALMEAKGYDSYQFVRNGFYCADIHDSKEGAPVFNRIVSLKSSFRLPK